ncbi:NYN domain-containing protein [Burkholderia multivorans]|uniref:NYN domain-containing protein n=1 Tax=Burkholderia multivorans TaxID=87883 RepID=UPI001C2197A3|nr:NYN domain-containing protein [Burkholderia multivorans]MBU9200125.1 NYN domain-containing protein [Burkholderia multivorans]MDN8078753.1 NYN domain-containing protein [Burkholderia multivorans]
MAFFIAERPGKRRTGVLAALFSGFCVSFRNAIVAPQLLTVRTKPMSVNLTKIGIFFDGSYFSGVSSYYLNEHQRHARLSITGIRNYVVQRVAREEGVDSRHCRIVEAHLFAGRISAFDARERETDVLFKERQWDEILQREDVTAHYMPMGLRGEKGIDVSLALECYESVVLKGLDVVVLVTGDGDFVPLVRKLNARGVRAMVLGWSYAFADNSGRQRSSTTSRVLFAEATYPIQMDELIDRYDELSEDERDLIDALFIRRRGDQEDGVQTQPAEDVAPVQFSAPAERAVPTAPVDAAEPTATRSTIRTPQFRVARSRPATRERLERFVQQGFSAGPLASEPEPVLPLASESEPESVRVTGKVIRILDGYGFIESDWGDSSIFFHRSAVVDVSFDQLQLGTAVSYVETEGDRGPVARDIRMRESS